jgi:hypothetical protein
MIFLDHGQRFGQVQLHFFRSNGVGRPGFTTGGFFHLFRDGFLPYSGALGGGRDLKGN